NQDETELMMSQLATSNHGSGGRRYQPYVFTEHWALMLASFLNSEKAIQASIQIVRAFVRLRKMLATHQELARKLAEMEKKYNAEFKRIEGGPRGRRTGHSRAAARNHGKRSETASKCSEMNSSGRWKRTAGGRNVSRMSTGNGR